MNEQNSKSDEISRNFEEVNVKCESNFKKLGDKINEMEENFNKSADNIINKMNKRDEKWEGDRRRLKEDTEGESKQVSGCNGVNYNYESIVGVESGEETDQLNENKDDQVT